MLQLNFINNFVMRGTSLRLFWKAQYFQNVSSADIDDSNCFIHAYIHTDIFEITYGKNSFNKAVIALCLVSNFLPFPQSRSFFRAPLYTCNKFMVYNYYILQQFVLLKQGKVNFELKSLLRRQRNLLLKQHTTLKKTCLIDGALSDVRGLSCV